MLTEKLFKLQRTISEYLLSKITKANEHFPELERYMAEVKKYPLDIIPSSEDSLLESVQNSEITFLGDYHDLEQSQKATLTNIKKITTNKKVHLGLEMLLSNYKGSNIRDLRKHFTEQFSGDWSKYKPLLKFALSQDFDIYGLQNQELSFEERDNFAAELIAQKIKTNPYDTHLVLIGELHLCPHHLPQKLNQALERTLKQTIIVQNIPKLFYREFLFEQNIFELTSSLSGMRRFCITNAPPAEKYWSTINRQGISHEEDFISYLELVLKSLAEFLELDIEYGENLRSSKTDIDISKFNIAVKGEEDYNELLRRNFPENSVLIPTGIYGKDGNKVLYVTNHSINHIAQATSHIIKHNIKPPESFEQQVTTEALAYLCSALVNPFRKPKTPEQLRQRMIRSRSDLTKRIMYEFLKYIHDQNLDSKDQVIQREVAYRAGQLQGRQLFEDLIQGKITIDKVRDLFYQ